LNAEPPDDAAKRVVIDASALIALIAREPESDAVTVHFAGWISDRVELHAPELARYEIANALTRKMSHGEVQADDLPAVWAELDAMPIAYHPLTDGVATISLAISLERRSAFDAAYVALARELDAELWTLDGPLARNAASRAYPVSLIESSSEDEKDDESDADNQGAASKDLG
jgi:predicted nucleic acid-binding protein